MSSYYIHLMFDDIPNIPTVEIQDPLIEKHGIQLFIKREDMTNAYISGNKYRKLKYNLIEAKKHGYDTLLTFGGAYSNHIHATAYAGNNYGFKTIGVIRGEATLPLNPTLSEANSFGMSLHYISRTTYRNKMEDSFIDQLRSQFGDFYLIPEGGSNKLAVKGCSEIIDAKVETFDHICCATGTGGTLAGIISGLEGAKRVWGFPALKNAGFLKEVISDLIWDYKSKAYSNWDLLLNYHFGGYAKFDNSLISFINKFKKKHKIPLDPIYTGKLIFGIYDLTKKGFFKKGEKVLAIHTGGLQGINGFNIRFGSLIK